MALVIDALFQKLRYAHRYASGPGPVALAIEPPSVARAGLEKCERTDYTKQTVADIDELMHWLEEIHGENSVAAFNISLPVSRWSSHDLHKKIVP